jgi:hypothetical integral membrane protein (TIGR02206 family)
MTGVVSPVAYGVFVSAGALVTAFVVYEARRRPGRWTGLVARALGSLLLADAVSYLVALAVQGSFSAKTSLPLPLCDMGVIVAAAACWWKVPTLVELTYFWGMAGTLQALITPDLSTGFPHLVFFQYMVGHVGIVIAALMLVVGMQIKPRAKAVARVFAITAAYTAVVGAVDAASGANYMFLRQPPSNWTLLRVLGPWPWYVLSAAGVALALLIVLDAPFWRGRSGTEPPRASDEGSPRARALGAR